METPITPRRRGLSRRWLFGGIVVVVAAAVLLYISSLGRAAPTMPDTVPVTRGSLVATVTGSGSVAAEQSVDLLFRASGTVTEVLVKEGDVVEAGQVLARIDDRDLQLQVEIARSNLESAEARLAQTLNGNATPEEIAAAEAAVASAQATYDKVAQGPAPADLAAAQAAVNSAQAAYDAAVKAAETTNSQLLAARAALEKAEAAKRKAQADYDRVASEPNIGSRPEALALQSATIDYEQAKANYDALAQTADVDAKSRVDAAAAQLEQAKAALAALTPRSEDLRSAQAALDQAKANLARLTAPRTESDVRIQRAAVTQAEQALRQAELALEHAALTAPFDGVVARVNVVPGSMASPSTPALTLINRDPLHVDLRLSENDVAKVELGQPVAITLQSLGGWQTNGAVSFIAPAADNINGVVTYVTRISFPDDDPRVKVGMTADLSIEVARKENVLLVPNTALLPKGTGRVVQVIDGDGEGGLVSLSIREVEVVTGLSDGTYTEIVSGLSEGQQVVALPDIGTRSGIGSGDFFGGM